AVVCLFLFAELKSKRIFLLSQIQPAPSPKAQSRNRQFASNTVSGTSRRGCPSPASIRHQSPSVCHSRKGPRGTSRWHLNSGSKP
ncbi:unnamed protein product, partial [Brassica oleracea var. botrytis]